MNRKLAVAVKDYIIITFGISLFALVWIVFFIPAGIKVGGFSGIGAVLYFAAKLPESVTSLSINMILLLIAIKIPGANFVLKIIGSILILTLFFAIFRNFVKEPLVNDLFLWAVPGGIAGGIGLEAGLSRVGSAGNTGIFAMVVNKYRNLSPGRNLVYCDVIIFDSSCRVFHSPEKLVYGYVSMGVGAYSFDSFLRGINRLAQMFIILKNHEKIIPVNQ